MRTITKEKTKTRTITSSGQGTVTEQLDQYLAEVQHTSDMAPAIATLFWKQKSTV